MGDAHTCTNPLYGRGCSLAMVQAQLVADALADAARRRRGVGRAYEAACGAEMHPWYRASVAQDEMNRQDAARDRAVAAGEITVEAATAAAEENPVRAMLRDGLLPAMRVDPVVLRAFLRMFNLLEPPDSLHDQHGRDRPRDDGVPGPRPTPARAAAGPGPRPSMLEALAGAG